MTHMDMEIESPVRPGQRNHRAKRKPTFAMSADSRLIYQRLVECTAGEVVTHEELSKIVGRKVDGSFGPLHTARRACRREKQIVFDAVMGVGLKCLTDVEKVLLFDRIARRFSRAAKSKH